MTDMSIINRAPQNAEEAREQALFADNRKFAMWLYLASEVVIFSVFIAAFAVFRANEPELVKEVHEALGFAGILLITFNTFLLLTSSWAMVMGLRAMKKGDRQGLLRWLGATAALGTVFVVLQYIEYQNLAAESITLGFASDAFGGFGMHFYVPTAFHGLHVIIGVIWCLGVMRHAARGGYSQYNTVGIEMFGLYWHFVDVVWIILFTLIYLI